MKEKIRILHLEDNPHDAELVLRALRRDGVDCEAEVVATREAYESALPAGEFDIIFADYTLPRFDGMTALSLAGERACGKPFIFVTGTLGEEVAIESLKHGATDYVVKNQLSRLAPAVRRAMQEYEDRRELEKNNGRQKSLLDLYQTMADVPVQEMVSFVIDTCIKLTESRIGFIGFTSDDGQTMTAHLWSERVMAQCELDKPLNFPLTAAGLWAEPIRQGRAMIVNDYGAPNTAKKGYPEGHLAITRFLGVPLLDRDRVVAVACLGNKAKGYTEADEIQVSLVLEGMWDLIKRQRAEEALRQSEAELREVQRVAGIGSWQLEWATGAVTWSEEIYRLFGLDPILPAPTYQGLQTILTAESMARLDAAINETLQTTQPFALDLELIRPDRTRRWIASHGELRAGGEGPFTIIRGTAFDITERKLAEETLKLRLEELERFRAATIQREFRLKELKERVLVLEKELKKNTATDEGR
jgi:GAF domain-containing protein/CheY-like chemotaxis protein